MSVSVNFNLRSIDYRTACGVLYCANQETHEDDSPMPTISHQCPHCLIQHLALRVVGFDTARTGENFAHLKCPACGFPCAAEVFSPQGINGGLSGWINTPDDLISAGYRVGRFWPEPPKPVMPEHLPESVERAYRQAEDNFPKPGNEDAAGTMYRKALDMAVKHIDPAGKGMLGHRLDALAKAGRLTPDIADWARQIKDLGNEAAHDQEPPSRLDIEDLRGLTEMVLRYLFTLPEMVRRKREETGKTT